VINILTSALKAINRRNSRYRRGFVEKVTAKKKKQVKKKNTKKKKIICDLFIVKIDKKTTNIEQINIQFN
jgi:hypothetical protein